MRSLLPLSAALLLAACLSSATKPSRGYLEIVEGTTRITCRGTGMEGAFGSRLARGPMLVAPGGDRAAWVEVEAQALPANDDEGSCQNVSRLWIRDGNAPVVAFVQKPGWEGRNGNALDLIDWSPDGSRLLIELHTWTYPTDPADPTLLIWDARTRTVEQLDAAARLAERFGSDCAFRLRGNGFAADGSILFSVEAPASAPAACTPGARTWQIAERGLTAGAAAPSRWSTTATPPPVARAADPD